MLLSLGAQDCNGGLAVQPTTRAWMLKGNGMQAAVSVTRAQCPLLPQKQCTLHGLQGKTADPGFIAHWKSLKRLKRESVWLAYYVSLSRPRSLSRLLSHGLPVRSIIEGGPPESIADAFKELVHREGRCHPAGVRAGASGGGVAGAPRVTACATWSTGASQSVAVYPSGA